MTGDLHRYAAVNARVRALRTGLLHRTGLESLCAAPSMAAAMDALRHSAYGTSSPAELPLEALLRRRRLATGHAVLTLLTGPEHGFIRTYLQRDEVESLKVTIRGVHAGWPWPAVEPYVADGPGTLPFESLLAARDLRELVGRLDATPYHVALRGALAHALSAGPFALEVALDLDYYQRLCSTSETLRPADRARANPLLGTLFDALNLGWVARYREAGLSPEEILNYTLRHGRRFDDPQLRRMAVGQPAAWAAPGGADAPAPSADTDADPWTERWSALATQARRSLAGYPFHIGVPLGFLIAQDLEFRDLRVIFAGIRIAAGAAALVAHLASAAS